jgi:L-lactate utilization protein LutC
VAPIPEAVLHPKRPTRVEKGPHYDFHGGKEERSVEEKFETENKTAADKTTTELSQTSESTSTIKTVTSETSMSLSSINGVEETKTTEMLIFGPVTSTEMGRSQSQNIDQMKTKIQQERKFKHLVAIVAPLAGTFIFMTGLAIGVIILICQLDWVVLQRLRWHVSFSEDLFNFNLLNRDG